MRCGEKKKKIRVREMGTKSSGGIVGASRCREGGLGDMEKERNKGREFPSKRQTVTLARWKKKKK